jgi:glycosyltransferase involved in cell wall biosynthesis
MNVLFLTRTPIYKFGGVEKHIREISKYLSKTENRVKVISEKEIKYPKKRFLGLIFIWFWLLKNRKLIRIADVIHIHDVFVWYLPLKIIFPCKKIFLTLHGWEGVWPIPYKNILLKKIGVMMSDGSIAVGDYVEKYYAIKVAKIVYGATSKVVAGKFKKIKNSIVFLGRLEDDTGLTMFLKSLKKNKYKKIDFIGDGPLRSECEKYGTVHGFTDPVPFLKKAEYCVPGGYLAYIEAKQYGCKIITYANNELKEDYWKGIKKIKKFPTWSELADEYLDLWGYKNDKHK